MDLSLYLFSSICVSILARVGITTIEQLSKLTVLDLYLKSESLHDNDTLKKIRSQAMSDSLTKRTTMSYLPIDVTLNIEKILRLNGAEYTNQLYKRFQKNLPVGMRIQLFSQSLKANLLGRGYFFSEKYDIIAYSDTEPHPTSILAARIRELGRPINKTESRDYLCCSVQSILNYIKEMPGIIETLSNGHFCAPGFFVFSNASEETIRDFLETRYEFNPQEVLIALQWKSPEDLSKQEIKSQSDARIFIDEYIRRNLIKDWTYDEEDNCYVLEEEDIDEQN